MAQLIGVGQNFVRAAMAAPFLERGDEHALAVRWKSGRDEQALHELAEAHMRLVIALAVKFRHYGLPVADLIQEGHVGLLEAAARFDPEREVRFSTYATWWIRASMQDYILRNWSIVRGGTSSTQKALFFNLRRLRAKLSVGGEPTSTPSDRMDFLVDGQPLPDEAVGLEIDTLRRVEWLKEAMTKLSAREHNILCERRLSEDTVTLEALGARLGISKERVRQIENRAMEKLRAALAFRLAAETRQQLAAPGLSAERTFEGMRPS